MSKPYKIIGIDPGTSVLGYAVIEIVKKQITLHSLGVVHLSKYKDHYVKLQKIHEKVSFLMETYQPMAMAIEAPFFGKNVQSMLKLGRAQGVCIAAGMLQGVVVTEYSPRKIKQSISGNGNASKEQLSALLLRMLKLDTAPSYLDATDALGVAVCHHLQMQSPLYGLESKGQVKRKKKASWGSFVKENPNRVKK